MNRYDNVQVYRSILVHYRAHPKKLETLKIGQRGTLIALHDNGTADVQLEDFPALLVVPLKALVKLNPEPAPHTRE